MRAAGKSWRSNCSGLPTKAEPAVHLDIIEGLSGIDVSDRLLGHLVGMEMLAGQKNLYRLSLEAGPNQADGFDDVAEKLCPFGVEVLQGGFEQLPSNLPCNKLADEVLIDVTRPIDLPLIEHALRPTGRKILALLPI